MTLKVVTLAIGAAAIGILTAAPTLAQQMKPVTATEDKVSYQAITKMLFLQGCNLNRPGDQERLTWFEGWARTRSIKGENYLTYLQRKSRHMQTLKIPAMRQNICGQYTREQPQIRAKLNEEIAQLRG